MNIRKLTSIMLSLMMVLTTFAACDTTETIPDGSVPITPEESAMISEMLEEGMDEEEIAEVLSTMETTEATGETNGNTDVTEPSVVESVAPNGETARVTPTTAPRQTVTQTIRNADGSTSTVRVTATATPRPTGTATTVPTSTTTTTAPTSTTTTTAPTSASSTGKFKTSVEDELVGLINNLRKTAAVNSQKAYYVPIQMRSTERTMAHTRAQELVNNFSHSSASGISLGSECIYKGSASSASAIFGAWSGSSSHNTMMRGGATSSSRSVMYCGIGVWYYNGMAYAVYGTKGYESGTGLPSGYTVPETTTPTTTTTVPTSTTTTATPTETTAPTTTTTTAAPTETTVVTTEATTQAQNSTVDDTGDSGGDG